MSRAKFDIQSERVQLVLNVLKFVGIVAVAAIAPNALQLFKPTRRYPEISYINTLYYLRRRGEVKVWRKQGRMCARLTRQGIDRLARLESLSIRPSPQKPDKWDGKWRVVIFDISERERRLRDAFRLKLRELECVQLQGSVWVTPYEIKDQLASLRKAALFNKISVQLLQTVSFDEESRFRRLFRLPLKRDKD